MKIVRGFVVLLAAVVFLTVCCTPSADRDRVVPDGGIRAGWTGKIDASSARQGRSLNDARLVQESDALRVSTGPATTFWNPMNTATGNYVVSATFTEPQFMTLTNHPHSYGIFIGGHDMGTDQMSLVYCVAYGDGSALVRGFGGSSVFTPMRQTKLPSVHKAPAVGQPVTQEIAWRVKDGRAECVINGAVVASYDKGSAVLYGDGNAQKLKSTDGAYGLRFTHNVEALVRNLSLKGE